MMQVEIFEFKKVKPPILEAAKTRYLVSLGPTMVMQWEGRRAYFCGDVGAAKVESWGAAGRSSVGLCCADSGQTCAPSPAPRPPLTFPAHVGGAGRLGGAVVEQATAAEFCFSDQADHPSTMRCGQGGRGCRAAPSRSLRPASGRSVPNATHTHTALARVSTSLTEPTEIAAPVITVYHTEMIAAAEQAKQAASPAARVSPSQQPSAAQAPTC